MGADTENLAKYRAMVNKFDASESPLVSQKKVLMTDIENFGPRRTMLKTFIPVACSTSTKDSAPPLVLYIRGGGFHLGSNNQYMYREICEQIAFELDALVCMIEYRSTPEHEFPAAYDDVVDTAKYIVENASVENQLSFDPKRVVVCGLSAGACLGALVAKQLQKACIGQVLIVPYVVLQDTPSREKFFTTSPFWKGKQSVWGWKRYLGKELYHKTMEKIQDSHEDEIDPRISPLYVPDDDLKDVCKAWIGVGEFDVECDGGRLLAEKFRRLGKLEEMVTYPCGHLSLTYGKAQHKDQIAALKHFLGKCKMV